MGNMEPKRHDKTARIAVEVMVLLVYGVLVFSATFLVGTAVLIMRLGYTMQGCAIGAVSLLVLAMCVDVWRNTR